MIESKPNHSEDRMPSGRSSGSVLRALRSRGFMALVDQGQVSLLNFVTILLLARWFDDTGFGIFILAAGVLAFGISLQQATITRAHNVLGASRTGDAFATFTGSVLFLSLAGAVATALLSLTGAAVFGAFDLQVWARASLAISLAAIPWLVQDTIRRILYTKSKTGAAALNDLVSFGLQAAGIVLVLFMGVPADILMAFFILGASSLVACLIGIVQIQRECRLSMGRVRSDMAEIWRFGKWLSWGEMVGWLGQNGHAWLIGGLFGADIVGGYRAAMHVTNLLNPIDMACTNFLPSEAARVYQEEGKQKLTRWLSVRFVLFGLPYLGMVIGMIFGARFLLDLFYSGRFTADILIAVVSIAAVSRFVGFFRTFMTVGMMATGRTAPLFVEKVISLVFFGSGSVLLITTAGLVGAPLARLSLGLIIAVYLVHSYRSLDPETLESDGTSSPGKHRTSGSVSRTRPDTESRMAMERSTSLDSTPADRNGQTMASPKVSRPTSESTTV